MAKFKLIKAGVSALLFSEEMMEVCQEYANAVRERCGEGYETSRHKGKSRVNVSIYAATPDAYQDNLNNNTLLKAAKV